MPFEELTIKNTAFWTDAILAVTGNNPPITATWSGTRSIHEVLQPFSFNGMNHAHLPTGGGMDILGVHRSSESDCLDFRITRRSAWILRPESVTLEYISRSPIDSFLLLELAPLKPSGVTEARRGYSEELVELGPSDYAERYIWDQGYFGHDENGYEIPLPEESRLVIRWLKGKILIVAKRSLWNRASQTYRGIHETMESRDIRNLIERNLLSLVS